MHRRGVLVPGIVHIRQRYLAFQKALTSICRIANLDRPELSFVDYRTLVTAWLSENL